MDDAGDLAVLHADADRAVAAHFPPHGLADLLVDARLAGAGVGREVQAAVVEGGDLVVHEQVDRGQEGALEAS